MPKPKVVVIEPEKDEDARTTNAYQLEHGRCKKVATFAEARLWRSDQNTIYEVKEDGRRYFLQIRPNGARINYLTSRHTAVATGNFVEKQDQLPFIRDFRFDEREFRDTVIDGEIVGGSNSHEAATAMVSGNVKFVYWDVVMFKGNDLRSLSLVQRRRVLNALCPAFPPWMERVKTHPNEPNKLLDFVIAQKKEGIVRKELLAPYGEQWTKVKGQELYDTVIWGYEVTKSADWAKKGWIGAIRLGQWRQCKQAVDKYRPTEPPKPNMRRVYKGMPYIFVDVGNCSGLTQEERAEISADQRMFLGEVVEIECQERLPSGKFRNPRFNRYRDDKDAISCIFGQR